MTAGGVQWSQDDMMATYSMLLQQSTGKVSGNATLNMKSFPEVITQGKYKRKKTSGL